MTFGVPRLPLALKTAAAIAMPKAAPNHCGVFKMPAALPSDAGETAFKPAERMAAFMRNCVTSATKKLVTRNSPSGIIVNIQVVREEWARR